MGGRRRLLDATVASSPLREDKEGGYQDHHSLRPFSRSLISSDQLAADLEAAALAGYAKAAGQDDTTPQCKAALDAMVCDGSALHESSSCGTRPHLCRIDFAQYKEGDFVSGHVGCKASFEASRWDGDDASGAGGYFGPNGHAGRPISFCVKSKMFESKM